MTILGNLIDNALDAVAALLGGAITVSEPSGATFTVSLPVSRKIEEGRG